MIKGEVVVDTRQWLKMFFVIVRTDRKQWGMQ